MPDKPTRGGAREGAGRKQTDRTEHLRLKVSPEARENIRRKASEKEVSENQLVDDWAKKLKTKKR